MGTPKGQRFGGRQKGTPNKSTSALKLAAQKHTKAALQTIVTLMTAGDSDQVRLAASRELLDRGYGKPNQAITGEDGKGPIAVKVIHEYLP